MPQVEIRLGGHLDKQWAEWFEDFSITHTEQDETLLIGTVADQAALYGLMGKLRDLGVKLLSARFGEHSCEGS
jgi:hypothetical protein